MFRIASVWARVNVARAGLPVVHGSLGFECSGHLSADYLLHHFPLLPPGITELICHPGESDPETLRRAHQGAAGYLQDVGAGGGAPNFTDLSPELSRDFRGLRLWLPIQLHGLRAFKDQIQEKLDLARLAYDGLKDDPSFEMLDEPQLSIVAFTARPRSGDPDAFGAEVLRRVNARRRVFLSSSTIGGRYVLRICVLSFRTHADRVRDAVTGLKEEARRLAGV